MATSINNLSEEIQNQIIKAYKNNMSLRQIEQKFNATRSTVGKFLEKRGIKTSQGNHYRKYFHDINFFEQIDTEEKAYWLGFMFADGYIVNNENNYGEDDFGLTLAEDSLDCLEKFKSSLKATNPIRSDTSKAKGQTQYKLVIRSQKTVNDLISHGCVKQKSLILEPPKGVPQELIKHFIRGFFDGDGSLTRCQSKDGSSINFTINITSTFLMISWIYEILGKGNIFPEKRRENTWYYSLGGNLQVLNFCHYIYDDATIWMDRKYARYQELLHKYSESQGIKCQTVMVTVVQQLCGTILKSQQIPRS